MAVLSRGTIASMDRFVSRLAMTTPRPWLLAVSAPCRHQRRKITAKHCNQVRCFPMDGKKDQNVTATCGRWVQLRPSASQAECRGFDSHRPLQPKNLLNRGKFQQGPLHGADVTNAVSALCRHRSLATL